MRRKSGPTPLRVSLGVEESKTAVVGSGLEDELDFLEKGGRKRWEMEDVG